MILRAAEIVRRREAMDALDGGLTIPPPGGSVVGWRVWRISATGDVLAPFASLGPNGSSKPWQPGINQARCLNPAYRHSKPPAPGCECGFRAMTLDGLYASMAIALGPWWRAALERELGAVGEIELSGRIVGRSPGDPATALRGSHARMVSLCLAERHADHADRIGERLGIPVTVGFPEPDNSGDHR